MGRSGLRLGTLVAVTLFVLGACGTTSPTPVPSTTQAPATPAPTSQANSGGTTLRWFVGLDALGTQANQIDAEKAFVANYNAVNKEGIKIKLEVEPTTIAADVLKTEMAAGNVPDIIGPIGVGGLSGFAGLFLDLTSEIHSNNVDLTAYDSNLVKFFQQGDQGQVGLPYLISPGYIWYNKDLFTKAGLPPLPTKVGDTYQDQVWDWNELGKVAAQLTVDKTGKKSTDPKFDAKNIVQYGLDFQGVDARRIASCFGSGSFVGSDGKTAQVPPIWPDAFSWYYNAIQTGHYVPTATVEASALLAQGNSQASGAVAMNVAWASSIRSIATSASTSKVKTWDIGVMPSWKGNTTSPISAYTFSIAKASRNPDAAFKVMLAIMTDPTLMQGYGTEPAKTADQASYFTSLDSTLAQIFPGNKVTWSVLAEMEKHPAVPSPESSMPDLDQANTDIGGFLNKLQTTSGLDVNGELTKLQQTLQADFDSVQALVDQ